MMGVRVCGGCLLRVGIRVVAWLTGELGIN